MKGASVPTDYVLLFPNNKNLNCEFFTNSRYSTDIKADNSGALRIEEDMNLDVRRLFACGDSASTKFFVNQDRYNYGGTHKQVNEGVHTAFNLMGLVTFYF